MTRQINLYRDHHSGGWVLEIRMFGRWERIGIYGTREAAVSRSRNA